MDGWTVGDLLGSMQENPRAYGRVEGHKGPRPLRVIAREIRGDWRNPYFGAVPYLDAMSSLTTITDRYYEDSADSIVRYFLANAGTWRGDTARRVKAELRGMLK